MSKVSSSYPYEARPAADIFSLPPSLWQVSSPRRRLPWDVLSLVFEQADPATLAVLGRVSLDFLQESSLVLYDSVAVDSVEKLEQLFCERKPKGRKTKVSPASVLPHLRLFLLLLLTLPHSAIDPELFFAFPNQLAPLPLPNSNARRQLRVAS